MRSGTMLKRFVFAMLVGVLARSAWAVTDVDSLVDLLSQKGTISKEEAASLRTRDVGLFYGKSISITGYNQVLYKHDDTLGTFDGFSIRRARLEVKGDLTEQMFYDFQADFAGASAKLLDSSIGYRFDPCLKFTLGQFKLPFSQENLSSDVNPDTINRSQVVEALVARTKDVVGNQNGRDTGFQASGQYNIVEYAAGVFNGAGIDTADTNEQKDYVERLVAHPIKELSVGGSFYQGSYFASAANTAADRKRAGVEFDCEIGQVSVKGEYLDGRDALISKQGWYGYAGYFLLPKVLQAVVKYDAFDPNMSATNDDTTVCTYGVNWHLAKWALVQVNYEQKREKPTEIKNDVVSGQFTFAF